MPNYRFKDEARSNKKSNRKYRTSGKGLAQIYSDVTRKKAKAAEEFDINQTRKKDKKNDLVKQINLFVKQNAMETATGMSLPPANKTAPQMANMTGATPQQAQKTIARQQTANRSMAQQPQQRTFAFTPAGAISYDRSLEPKIKEFSSLPPQNKSVYIDKLNPNTDYSMLKYIATKGDPRIQARALGKLNNDDIEQLVTPNSDNPEAVGILAVKTRNPANWKLLAANNMPLIRANLVKNPNIPEAFLKDMYDDADYQVRYNIVDRAKEMPTLKLFTSDKNPNIRMKIIPKLAANMEDPDALDALEIIAKTDKNPQVANLARRVLSKKTTKMEKEDDEFATAGDKHNELPEYGYGTAVGSMGSAQGSYMGKSLVIEISDFLTKAEIEKEKLIAERAKKLGRIAKEFGTVASGGFTPTYGGGGGKPKSNKEVERILGLVKSVGKEFFGEY